MRTPFSISRTGNSGGILTSTQAPRPGTPMAHLRAITAEECLAAVAVFPAFDSFVLRAGVIDGAMRPDADGLRSEEAFDEWFGTPEPEAEGAAADTAPPAPLELDHRNGDRTDNRLENLQLLCAPCNRDKGAGLS